MAMTVRINTDFEFRCNSSVGCTSNPRPSEQLITRAIGSQNAGGATRYASKITFCWNTKINQNNPSLLHLFRAKKWLPGDSWKN